jgi:transposase
VYAAQAFGSAEIPARVARKAIRDEATVAQSTVKDGVPRTMIGAWKKQAVDGV